MNTKLIISSLIGIGTLGGATVGSYYWLSNKDSEKSKKVENSDDDQQQQANNSVDTSKTREPTTSAPAPQEKLTQPEPSSAVTRQEEVGAPTTPRGEVSVDTVSETRISG